MYPEYMNESLEKVAKSRNKRFELSKFLINSIQIINLKQDARST
jgi:hypothetical protein